MTFIRVIRLKVKGFTLLELVIVIGIVAFLSLLALPSFMGIFSKAKRTEAYTQLRALYMAEKAYFAEKGTYSTNLTGTDGIGWKPEGQTLYSYGFSSGSEGKNYIIGSLKAPASALTGTFANASGFLAGAAADIDGDGQYDYLTIDQNGAIKIVKDDLS